MNSALPCPAKIFRPPPIRMPTAPSGVRVRAPSGWMKRPLTMRARRSGSWSRRSVRLLATIADAVGPTPSVSSLCWWPLGSLSLESFTQVRSSPYEVMKKPGWLENAQGGIS
jgi:hypothetical protein